MTTSATPELDAACLTAHRGSDDETSRGLLVAVFAGPVAHELLLIGARLGYSIALIDPDPARAEAGSNSIPGLDCVTRVAELGAINADTDVVMTDHHREELGSVLSELLGTDARWIGLMGNPRHEGPHVSALRSLGHDDDEIARVHRPIGLNIGSRTPAEIAVCHSGRIAGRSCRTTRRIPLLIRALR